jgi:hypothetical protein
MQMLRRQVVLDLSVAMGTYTAAMRLRSSRVLQKRRARAPMSENYANNELQVLV